MAEKKATSRRGPRVIPLQLPTRAIAVYANARVADALQELMADMSLYHGVKFSQVVQAVYAQGLADGRREVFDGAEKLKASPELKNRNPGRPANVPAKRSLTKKSAKKAPAKNTPT
jgi:hypothetical protein